MSDLLGADFLGAFAVVQRGESVLLVGNDRKIAGVPTRVWDLPGGRVEAGELLHEAVARELREETGLCVHGAPRFLFVQEGERCVGGARKHAWRSFFFAVDVEPGEPRAGAEVLATRWMDRATMQRELTAPYHDSFRQWLVHGGLHFVSRWDD
jgi:ADP-ribose pyrophosphatase YjhB (NUDIX family)